MVASKLLRELASPAVRFGGVSLASRCLQVAFRHPLNTFHADHRDMIQDTTAPEHDDAPQISIAVGITVALVASLVQSLGQSTTPGGTQLEQDTGS